LETNPDSYAKSLIKAELGKLDRALTGRKKWKSVAAYCKNKQNDIFDRIESLNVFTAKNPSSKHTKEARVLMQQLQAEKRVALRRHQEEETRRNKAANAQQRRARLEKIKREMAAQLKRTGGRFVDNGNGTITDSTTGLTWTMLDSSQSNNRCYNYESSKYYINNLRTGGYKDWRLPTNGELWVLYKKKPFFPSSSLKWYWTADSFWKGAQKAVYIVTSKKESIFKKEYKNYKQCGAIRAVRP